jgi:hypothetical protein
MDLKVVTCGDMDWIQLVQDRVQWWALVNMVMILWVPSVEVPD